MQFETVIKIAGRYGRICSWLLIAPILLGAGAGAAYLVDAGSEAPEPAEVSRYAPQSFADRIILTPGADASREMAVAFRTDTGQTRAEAEIALAMDGPYFKANLQSVTGFSHPLHTENGEAIYHHIRFAGLQPDTAYIYRVKGLDSWSEWFPFRTATDRFRPFRFLYFGDVQNDILSGSSRVIRQAFIAAASPSLALHAGDFVNRRVNANDDEWGEWFESIEYNAAIIPQLPAPGNHEYVRAFRVDLPEVIESNPWVGKAARLVGLQTLQRGQAWNASFVLPGNGADPEASATYYVDYQGVRFVVLDGTAALDLGALPAQSKWLEEVLSDNHSKWTIVLFHQPVVTCHEADDDRNADRAVLKEAWDPIFIRFNVDVILQGHDHCYGRTANRTRSSSPASYERASSPVYIVSVVGTKTYEVDIAAQKRLDRVAEDTQLYQIIDVENDRLVYRAFTATGRLYDGFSLVRGGDGRNVVQEFGAELGPIRICSEGIGPDGAPCSVKDRAQGED